MMDRGVSAVRLRPLLAALAACVATCEVPTTTLLDGYGGFSLLGGGGGGSGGAPRRRGGSDDGGGGGGGPAVVSARPLGLSTDRLTTPCTTASHLAPFFLHHRHARLPTGFIRTATSWLSGGAHG
jgi:hypothetical protein